MVNPGLINEDMEHFEIVTLRRLGRITSFNLRLKVDLEMVGTYFRNWHIPKAWKGVPEESKIKTNTNIRSITTHKKLAGENDREGSAQVLARLNLRWGNSRGDPGLALNNYKDEQSIPREERGAFEPSSSAH